MKTLVCLFVASFSVAVHAGDHLFILSGQSNMAGLKPEISFTPAVEKEFGKEHVVVVKSAQGGQPIRRWYKEWKPENGVNPPAAEKPGAVNAEGTGGKGGKVAKPAVNGDLYEVLMTAVRKAIEGRTFESVTFVWMQGERDAKEGNGGVYAESLRGLVAQLSADLGRKDINFVIGRLSDFANGNKGYPHWDKVREVQVAAAEASDRGAWVDTDDLNDIKAEGKPDRNDLHYTKEGYRILGERFAEAAIRLIRAKSPKQGQP